MQKLLMQGVYFLLVPYHRENPNRWRILKVCRIIKEEAVGLGLCEVPSAKGWTLEDESTGSVKRETSGLNMWKYKQGRCI